MVSTRSLSNFLYHKTLYICYIPQRWTKLLGVKSVTPALNKKFYFLFSFSLLPGSTFIQFSLTFNTLTNCFPGLL
jgi:hypothetical protein